MASNKRPARAAPILEVLQPQDGGVAAHVLQVATGLRRRGWDIEVATPAASSIVEPLAEAGVPVHPLALVRDPGPSDVAAARTLRALDRERRYGLVHGHSSKAGALVRAALPDARRLLYTPHCFAFAARFGGARRLAYRAIEQAAVSRSAAIVAVCEWERQQAAALWGAATRVQRIPHGVATCDGADPDPELVAFKGDEPLAGMVSVLRPQKDPLFAIRAVARLAASGRLPGRFAIVGNGPIEAEVRAEIDRLGVHEHVRWFPYGGSVGPHLAALDLFVLPSAWEAMPLSLLEAMSCGLPILATDVGGTPEVVTDGVTGRLVPGGDELELALGLLQLLSDADLRARLGAAGRREWQSRFQVERMLDDTEALYRELLGARDASAPTPASRNGRLRVT